MTTLTTTVRVHGGKLGRALEASLLIVASLVAIALIGGPAVSATQPARSASSDPAPTTTVLTSTAKSATYDTPITFTAAVSASHPNPVDEGTVTFVDTENGSILDVLPVSDGTAVFTSSALAPGVRSVQADYLGDIYYSSSRSAHLSIAVAATDDATASQIDPQHDGAQPGLALQAKSLDKVWSVDPSGGVGAGFQNSLVADGMIFVTDAITISGGTVDAYVYALNAQNGQTEWSASMPSMYGYAGLAYDGHALFMANSEGRLTSFNADTGAVNWSLQTKSSQSYESVPTAFDGVVYFGGDSEGAVVYAITEASGVVDWNTTPLNGESGQLAVDDEGVFLSFSCQQDFRFSITGTLIWHNDTGCGGGGISTPVLANGYVYDEGFENEDAPEILSVSDGRQVGSFADQTTPAFGSLNMYVFHKDTLIAEGPLGKPKHWEFGNQTFAPVDAPVTDKSMVFIGAADGNAYGFSSNGTKKWTGVAGAAIDDIDGQPLTLGDGLLVALATNTVTAFGN